MSDNDRPVLRPAGGATRTAERAALARSTPLGRLVRRTLHRPDEAMLLGASAQAQERTARSLLLLEGDWRVVHDLPVAGADGAVHHLAVGPGGVCTLTDVRDAERIRIDDGRMFVDGRACDDLERARRAARRVAEALAAAGRPVRVDALVTLPDRGTTRSGSDPVGVTLVPRAVVRQHLHGRPPVLASHDVRAVFGLALRASTWQPTGAATSIVRNGGYAVVDLGAPTGRAVEIRVVLDADPHLELVTADGRVLAVTHGDERPIEMTGDPSPDELALLTGAVGALGRA
jgi:hypothetical protein